MLLEIILTDGLEMRMRGLAAEWSKAGDS